MSVKQRRDPYSGLNGINEIQEVHFKFYFLLIGNSLTQIVVHRWHTDLTRIYYIFLSMVQANRPL